MKITFVYDSLYDASFDIKELQEYDRTIEALRKFNSLPGNEANNQTSLPIEPRPNVVDLPEIRAETDDLVYDESISDHIIDDGDWIVGYDVKKIYSKYNL